MNGYMVAIGIAVALYIGGRRAGARRPIVWAIASLVLPRVVTAFLPWLPGLVAEAIVPAVFLLAHRRRFGSGADEGVSLAPHREQVPGPQGATAPATAVAPASVPVPPAYPAWYQESR